MLFYELRVCSIAKTNYILSQFYNLDQFNKRIRPNTIWGDHVPFSTDGIFIGFGLSHLTPHIVIRVRDRNCLDAFVCKHDYIIAYLNYNTEQLIEYLYINEMIGTQPMYDTSKYTHMLEIIVNITKKKKQSFAVFQIQKNGKFFSIYLYS